MSALRAPAAVPSRSVAPAPRRAPLSALPGGRSHRRLEAVRAPLQARSSMPFLAICGALLVVALLLALVLNTTMARGSYEQARLQRDAAQVAQDVQSKQAELRAAEASLPDRARDLGMVPAEDPTILSAVTGQVVGGAPAQP